MKKVNSFLECLDNFLNIYIIEIKGLSQNTQKAYKYAFKLLFDFLYKEKKIKSDKVTFEILDYNLLTEFLEWLEKERKCSPKTRNQRLAAISSFSEYASIRFIDATTTFRKAILNIPFKKTTEKQYSYFLKEELKILFNEPDIKTKIGMRNKAILTFMYASGARAQEVCDLKVCDINFDKDKTRIILHGKGKKTRSITIPRIPAQILKEYIDTFMPNGDAESYVFSSQTHKHMTVSCIEEIYKKYISSAKQKNTTLFCDKYSPHSMRHTTATHMVEAGVPLLIIKNFLGHSSIATTQIYASVSQKTMDNTLIEWNEKWLTKSKESNRHKSNIPAFLK